MVKAISERIELRDVDDVAPEIVAEAAAAALARLDALGVSPLQACLSQGRLEAMDDQGQLDAEEPAFAVARERMPGGPPAPGPCITMPARPAALAWPPEAALAALAASS